MRTNPLGQRFEHEGLGSDVPGDENHLGADAPVGVRDRPGDVIGVAFPGVLGAMPESALRPPSRVTTVDVQRLGVDMTGSDKVPAIEGMDVRTSAIGLDDDVRDDSLTGLDDQRQPRKGPLRGHRPDDRFREELDQRPTRRVDHDQCLPTGVRQFGDGPVDVRQIVARPGVTQRRTCILPLDLEAMTGIVQVTRRRDRNREPRSVVADQLAEIGQHQATPARASSVSSAVVRSVRRRIANQKTPHVATTVNAMIAKAARG